MADESMLLNGQSSHGAKPQAKCASQPPDGEKRKVECVCAAGGGRGGITNAPSSSLHKVFHLTTRVQ